MLCCRPATPHVIPAKAGTQYNNEILLRLHLVYFEETTDILSAIQREKRLKAWNRKRKLELIENSNPDWRDLFIGLA